MKTITLDGHLGRDPEIKTTPKGTSFISLSLANSSYIKGEMKTTWYDVVSFDVEGFRSRLQYFKKGSYVSMTGVPDETAFVAKDGSLKIQHQLQADRIEFLHSSNGERTNGDVKPANVAQTAPAPITSSVGNASAIPAAPVSVQEAVASSNDSGDDLPF